MAELRQRVDIVELIAERVALRPAGREFVGLCPFHQEKTPSFSVSRERGVYHCHGCHAGGDAVEFVRRTQLCGFVEAVTQLAERVGLAVPDARPLSAEERRQQAERQELYAACAAAAAHFQDMLLGPAGAEAIAYLRQRGVDGPTASRFGLGYAPEDRDGLGQALGNRFQPELLLTAGLRFSRSERPGARDRFRRRLMFPIWDEQGRVIGFGGRALDPAEQPKYLNSPETPLFRKRRVLYGAHLARPAIMRRKRVVVVEGYMDALSCHQLGFSEVVATLGTALSDEQAGMLARAAESVILAYDADRAGDAATERGLGILQEAGAELRVAEIPTGQDPDDLLRHAGPAAFAAVLDSSVPLIRHLVRRAVAVDGLGLPEQRWRLAQRIVPFLARASAGTRSEYTEWVARELMVDPRELQRAVDVLSDKGTEHRNRKAWNASAIPARPANRPPSGAEAAEETVLAACLHSSAWLRWVASVASIHDFSAAAHQALAAKLFERAREDPSASGATAPGLALLDAVGDQVERAELARLMARGEPDVSQGVLASCLETVRRSRLLREVEELRAEQRRRMAAGEGMGSPGLVQLTRRLTELTAELARSARGGWHV